MSSSKRAKRRRHQLKMKQLHADILAVRASLLLTNLSSAAGAFVRSTTTELKPDYDKFWEMGKRVCERIEKMVLAGSGPSYAESRTTPGPG